MLSATPTAFPEVLRLTITPHRDARGSVAELHRASTLEAAGLPTTFAQTLVSRSAQHTIRGLHFQHPGAQGKLISVLHGAITDVVVDVRTGSPTFARHIAVELNASKGDQLWIPAGFAHGFCALEHDTIVHYLLTAEYAPESERVIRWDDPTLGIEWPTTTPLLSPRDAAAPRLADVPPEQLPHHHA